MLEEEELMKSGMNHLEIKAHKRKIQRERGEYKPEIPPMTTVIKKLTLERERSNVGSFMKKNTNMSIDTDNIFDSSMQLIKLGTGAQTSKYGLPHTGAILEEEDDDPESSSVIV